MSVTMPAGGSDKREKKKNVLWGINKGINTKHRFCVVHIIRQSNISLITGYAVERNVLLIPTAIRTCRQRGFSDG